MTKEAVLEVLRTHTDVCISGAEIGRQLSVSRTAVWKAVEQLKKEGYRIESGPNRGYRLLPDSDVLSEEGIRRYLIHDSLQVRVFPSISSTNTVLKQLAAEGAPEGLVLAAGEQTAGRGRMGRQFYSPPDTGLYMSLLLRPSMPAADVTLTAEFTPVEYTITYELNGGENSANNPGTYTVESETFTLEAPTREGFDFLGWYDDEFFKNDVVTEIEQGSTGELTLFARWKEQEYVSDWSRLQELINNADHEAVITLTQDYYAEQNDVALTIKNGKKLTIDLNGHTLDADGNAIRIFEIQNGDLTIKDSSGAGGGTITGGNAGNSVGGAIIVRTGGTLTLNGGQITNCSASNGGAIALTAAGSLFTMNGGTISYNSATWGGGVHVQLGTFVMNGGSIKNNSASENGGGLYATQNADITFTGGRIEQNTAEKGSVYLNSVGMKVSGDLYIESVYLTDPLITVTGPLTENSKIGLTYSNNAANNGKTLTSGLDRNGTLEHFFSAKNGYLTGLTPDGEIVMGTPVTVSFDSNGGSEVGPQTIAKNSIAAAPADPVYGRHIFKGWCLGSEAYDFSTPVADDLTLSAVWEEQYTITINADEGCTVTVMVSETDEDGTPIESGDTVPYGTVLQVSAVAKTGCRLTETPEKTYTVTGDLTISAKSEALKFTLTAAATEGGTEPAVSVEDPVPYGTEVTVTASEPAETYEFIGW